MKKKLVSNSILSGSVFLLTACLAFKKQQHPGAQKFNVLFIAVDDLKPDIHSFGFAQTITPNIDELASRGTIFNGNYCQQAVCGPTRASLLTGVRPDKTKVWDLQTLIRDKNPDIITLPQYFRQNGYTTIGMGKIFDPRSVDKKLDERSWSEPYKKKFKLAAGYEDLAMETYQSPAIKEKARSLSGAADDNEPAGKQQRDAIKVATECLEVPDDAYTDGAMANYAVKQLKEMKNSSSPFFMAVGFKKPHLPFVAPKKYWDLYDRNKIELAAWQKKSINGPDVAYHNSGELRSYSDIEPVDDANKNGLLKLEEDQQKELIHGYYACISYIDAQIGKLMKALKDNGLDKNTIVVLWGDHGWHLGDHSLWCKHSNFEQAAKAPLLFRVPGLTKGNVYTRPTEFVDIFPTLCELTGIKLPSYLDGKSLVPAMKDNNARIKDFSISQYPRGGSRNGVKEIMGYSLRDPQYRYTEWIGQGFTTAQPFREDRVIARELYDLKNDPLETKNIAGDPAMKKTVDALKMQLHAYYKQQYETAGKVSE